jgi:uncharacterized protein
VIVVESTRTRRLVGRLDRGADILAQLADVCRTHGVRAGEVRAVGALEEAVVGEWDQRTRVLKPPRRFDAAFEILTLAGTVGERDGHPSVHAWVSLSRERDNGIELIGGRLVAGRVFACEFVIDAFDDLALARAVEPATGLPLWDTHAAAALVPAPEAVATPTPTPTFDLPARTSWSDVMAASERRAEAPREVPEPDEPLPPVMSEQVPVRPGDFIDHPKFGRVQVERVDNDQEFVSARLRNQRLIRLSLEVLTLIPTGQENGRNLFRAVAGK